MNKLSKAIEHIAYENRNFPEESFKIIAENQDAALPYLREAILKALAEKDDLEEDYQLHFYGLYFLGEFQDREFFSKIIELVSLPREILDYLLGDATTSGLKDILYNTYNGDLALIKNTIMNEYVDEFVRAALLDVMGQLYLDKTLDEKEWRDFLKQNVYGGQRYCYLYNELGAVICRCHFIDMLPEIQYMLNQGLMDEMCMGKYDSCVDEMFTYRDYEKNFCESPINTLDQLRSWAMFEQDEDPANLKKKQKAFEKLMQEARRNNSSNNPASKIGRNDPCPCGSGKKYKFCCLNRPKSPLDSIEDAAERNKCLENYPYIGHNRETDRIYLDDYFDAESIEIDRLLYLGLMNRPGLVWLKDEKKEGIRCREYLSLAFSLFKEKIQKERIQTFQEYDQKFSIHYFCDQWTEELMDLSRQAGNINLYHEVKNCRKAMQDTQKQKGVILDKHAMNKKWKKFGKLTDKCYNNMIGAEKDSSCWPNAFSLLKDIILEKRQENPAFASTLEMIDEETDYQYDIQGWLEDCLDEMDMREEYEILLSMCDDLLDLFSWPEYTSSDIKFRKASVLGSLGRKTDAANYCREWVQKEPENIAAAAAGVYAFTDAKEFREAEKLVEL